MMRRLIFPLLLGLVGCAILIGLGTWQLQRLTWKEGVLAEIHAIINEAPVPVPEAPTEAADQYRPVTASGALTGAEVLVFSPVEGLGIGYRVIGQLVSGDRSFLVDLGFVAQGAPEVTQSRMAEGLTVTGNLLWPDDVTASTPPPDPTTGVWYGRDVAGIAGVLGTEPVLIVAHDLSADLGTVPVPVSTSGIRNNHLEYVITWFLLAVVWAGMTGLLIWRVIRRKD